MSDEPASDARDEELVSLFTIERLLSPEFESGSASKQRPSFFIGRLPDNLPVGIPIPDSTRIVGSRPHGGSPQSEVEVVLDADMTAEHAREAYRVAMTEAGWSESDRHRGPAGFVSEAPPDVLLFCKGDRGPALFVRARDREDAPTDVRLSLIADERRSPCSPELPELPEHHELSESILPSLDPPPGGRIFPRSGGGSDEDVESTVILQTDLDLVSIGTYYVEHLKSAGWSLLDAGGNGPQTWSTWSFSDDTDQPWNGVFTALRLPDMPQEHLLHLWARWSPVPPL